MTRRGKRSWAAIHRRWARRERYRDAMEDGRDNGALRWERRHGEGQTTVTAQCASCGLPRFDVEPQSCNARHPDGRLRAEALMLAVATYGSCRHCSSKVVTLTTTLERPSDLDAAWLLSYDSRRARAALSQALN